MIASEGVQGKQNNIFILYLEDFFFVSKDFLKLVLGIHEPSILPPAWIPRKNSFIPTEASPFEHFVEQTGTLQHKNIDQISEVCLNYSEDFDKFHYSKINLETFNALPSSNMKTGLFIDQTSLLLALSKEGVLTLIDYLKKEVISQLDLRTPATFLGLNSSRSCLVVALKRGSLVKYKIQEEPVIVDLSSNFEIKKIEFAEEFTILFSDERGIKSLDLKKDGNPIKILMEGDFEDFALQNTDKGLRLACGSQDGKICLYSIDSSMTLTHESSLIGHKKPLLKLLFNKHNEHQLISSCKAGILIIWDLNHSRIEKKLFDDENNSGSWIMDMRVIGSGKKIVFSKGDNILYVYDVDLSTIQFTVEASETSIISIFVNNKEEFAAMIDSESKLQVIKFTRNERRIISQQLAHSKFHCWTLSHKGEFLALGAQDTAVSLYNMNDWRMEKNLNGHLGRISCLAFSLDDKHLASGSWDNSIRIWSIPCGAPLYHVLSHTGGLISLTFCPNALEVVSCGQDQRIVCTKLENNIQRLEINRPHGSNLSKALYCSREALYLASFGGDKCAKIWDANNGTLIRVINNSNQASIADLFVIYEKNLLGIYFAEGSLRLYDNQTYTLTRQKCISSFPGTSSTVCLSNDGIGLEVQACCFEKWSYLEMDSLSQIYMSFPSLNRGENARIKALIPLRNRNKLITINQQGNEESLVTQELYSFRNACKIHSLIKLLRNNENLGALTESINEEDFRFLCGSFIIEPLSISLLHFLTYTKEVGLLKKVLLLSANYGIYPEICKDFSGRTAFDIAAFSGNLTQFHYLLKFMISNSGLGLGCCKWINQKFLIEILKLNQTLFYEMFKVRFIEQPLDIIIATNAKEKTLKLCSPSPTPLGQDVLDLISKRYSSNSSVYPKISQEKSQLFTPNIQILDINNFLLPNCGSESLFSAISSLDYTHPIFINEAFSASLDLKWKTYGQEYFLKLAAVDIVFIFFFIFTSSYPLGLEASGDSNRLLIGCNILLLLLWALVLAKNLAIIRASKRLKSISMIFNLIALSFCLLSILNGLCDNFCISQDIAKPFYSVSTILLWFRVLAVLKGFEGTAFLVRLISQVIIDLRNFALVVLIIFFGLYFSGDLNKFFTLFLFRFFSFFFLVLTIQNRIVDSYSSVFSALYLLVLGDFEKFQDLDSDASSLSTILFLLSTCILTVVSLNLLIAVLTDSYDKFIGIEKLSSNFEKCALLAEIDAILLENLASKISIKLKGYLVLVTNKMIEDNEGLSAGNDFVRTRDKITKIEKKLSQLSKLTDLESTVNKTSELVKSSVAMILEIKESKEAPGRKIRSY